jgi:hypothetical protein
MSAIGPKRTLRMSHLMSLSGAKRTWENAAEHERARLSKRFAGQWAEIFREPRWVGDVDLTRTCRAARVGLVG